MSNETKRDVFEGLLESYMYSADMVIDEISTDGVADRLNLGNIIASTRYRYDAALPDDLPVIPKAVGEWLKNCKHDECDLADAIVSSVNSIITSRRVTRWMEDHFDTFARVWVLGVWRVEETGEIVKVEAEK